MGRHARRAWRRGCGLAAFRDGRDRIVVGYNGCDNVRLYTQTNLRGAPASFYAANISALPAGSDNQTASIKLRTNCATYSSSTGVCGAIRDKYEALGGPGGPLGYPTSNELTNPDRVGKRTTFQNQNASIYWTPATGANEIQGDIYKKWGQFGYEAGILGYPTTDELNSSDNAGKQNTFFKTPATGWGHLWRTTGQSCGPARPGPTRYTARPTPSTWP